MEKVSITRKVVFHAGHMLKDDRSKCHAPHGHEYVLEVTVAGVVQVQGEETGMVMNFGRLKEILAEVTDRYDHKFLLDWEDPRTDAFRNAVNHQGVEILRFAPTAENLASFFLELIQRQMPDGIVVSHLKLQETLNCWAEIKP